MFSPRGRIFRSVAAPQPQRTFGAAGWARAFHSPGFLWLWLGQTVSAIGDRIYQVALAIALVRTLGAIDLAIALTSQSVVELVFVLLGGALSDRIRRASLMIGADALRGVAVALLGLVALGRLTEPIVVAVSMVMGIGSAIFEPGYGATIPDLVDEETIRSANSLTTLASRAALVIGPPVGGALVIAMGPAVAFFVDSATFVLSIVTLLQVKRVANQKMESEGSILGNVVAGLREVMRHRWYVVGTAVTAIDQALGFAPYAVLLPVIARARLGGAPAYGFALAAYGVGAIAGSLISGFWRPRRVGAVAFMSLWLIGAYFVALGLSRSLFVILVLAIFAGLATQLCNTYLVSSIQEEVPSHLQGRVYSVDFFGSMLVYPLGLSLTGILIATHVSATSLIIAAGLVFFVTAPLPLLVSGGMEFRTPGLVRNRA